MPTPIDVERYDCFADLTDRLSAQLPPDHLANVARLLAFNIAQYQRRYDKPLLGESLCLINRAVRGDIDEETVTLLSDGMEIFANALALSNDWQPHPAPTAKASMRDTANPMMLSAANDATSLAQENTMIDRQAQNRRRQPRIEIDTTVRCQFENTTLFEQVILENLSESGALIWTAQTLALGSHLWCVAEADDADQDAIEFQASVVRLEPRQRGSLYGYGCTVKPRHHA